MVCVFLLLVWKRATKLLWMTWIDSNLQLAKKWQRRIWQRSMKLSGIEEVNRCDFPSSLQCEVEVSTGRSQSDKITQQILVDMLAKIYGFKNLRQKKKCFFFFVSSIKILPQCLKVPEMKIAGTEEITGKMSQHHCPSPTLFPRLQMTLVLWSYTTVGLLCQ